MDADSVNVAIRIRPSEKILESSIGIEIISEDPPVLFAKERQQSYTFDNVFSKDAKQERIYNEMVKPLVYQVLAGYNCTVFAYGQTGTGKTFTIGSDPEAYKDAGFIPRTLDEFFDNQEDYVENDVSVSFFEIYNEKVFDLLRNSKAALAVKGFQIQDLAQEKVVSSFEAQKLLKFGSKNRHVGETKLNRNSSRSHAIFTIHCHVRHENIQTTAKLNLVDLAGSESARKTGNEGSQFQEGVNINIGLFNVGRVIHALSTNMKHIPYRQSMITTILHDSLNKTNYVTLVACISPDADDVQETIQTLDFAQQAKRLKIKPEVNNLIEKYKKDNPALFERPPPTSAVKIPRTPWKRPNYYSLQPTEVNSTAKKPKIVNHSWTPLPSTSNLSEPKPDPVQAVISPRSLFSMSVSTISDRSSILPQISISPIARKCIEVLEPAIKLQLDTFMSSIKKGTTSDRRNTPPFSWQQLQTEFRQIIRSEMIQLTGQRIRACSSPINDMSYLANKLDHTETNLATTVVAKRLDFGVEPPECEQANELVFKVPIARPRKAVKTVQMLPDDEPAPSTSAPRRSTRLSMKRGHSPIISASPIKRRQSSRLSVKRRASNVPKGDLQRPTPAPRKRINTVMPTDGSPASNHAQHILNQLNVSTQKELQKLPSIGPKTAAQIFVYRQLHGQFDCIADVGKMQSWRGNEFKRFLTANFLKIDDDLGLTKDCL